MKKESSNLIIDQSGNIRKNDRLIGKKKLESRNFDFSSLNIGYYIIIPIILGVILGLELDHWFKVKPFFTSSGIVLGTLASFYNLLKLLKK